MRCTTYSQCVLSNLQYLFMLRKLLWQKLDEIDSFSGLPRQIYQQQPREGFIRATQKLLRVQEGGLLHGGPPCSSFVWVNAGTSRRSSTCPEGDPKQKSVRTANETLGWKRRIVILRFSPSFFVTSLNGIKGHFEHSGYPVLNMALPFRCGIHHFLTC